MPAFYVAKSAVLTAFACGKSNALVVDGGANSICVTPVYDGFVLETGVRRTNIAGDFITSFYR